MFMFCVCVCFFCAVHKDKSINQNVKSLGKMANLTGSDVYLSVELIWKIAQQLNTTWWLWAVMPMPIIFALTHIHIIRKSKIWNPTHLPIFFCLFFVLILVYYYVSEIKRKIVLSLRWFFLAVVFFCYGHLYTHLIWRPMANMWVWYAGVALALKHLFFLQSHCLLPFTILAFQWLAMQNSKKDVHIIIVHNDLYLLLFNDSLLI